MGFSYDDLDDHSEGGGPGAEETDVIDRAFKRYQTQKDAMQRFEQRLREKQQTKREAAALREKLG